MPTPNSPQRTTAHEASKQPDDLKTVYDKAFAKIIAEPMQGFHDTVPIALEIVTAAANLGDYLDTPTATR